jgi:hypothetical protein
MAQFREAFVAKRRPSYIEIGHPKTEHIKGKWEHENIYTTN